MQCPGSPHPTRATLCRTVVRGVQAARQPVSAVERTGNEEIEPPSLDAMMQEAL